MSATKTKETPPEVAEAETKETPPDKAKSRQPKQYKCKEMCFSSGKLWKKDELRMSAEPLPNALWEVQ